MMAHIPSRLAKIITLTFSLAALGACVNLGGGTQQTTKFYVLNSLYSAKEDIEAKKAVDDAVIGVGPVQLPEYVNRPQIITRTSNNELEVASFARWAESLESNFSRVLAENLAVLLSTDRVIVYPWKGAVTVDYQVELEVTRFDGILGGPVSMRARWTVLGDNGEELLLRRLSSLSTPTETNSYEALVAAQSQLLADLSRQIAQGIQGLAQSPSAR
jgi:uncharacterized lipoprotein YmbA